MSAELSGYERGEVFSRSGDGLRRRSVLGFVQGQSDALGRDNDPTIVVEEPSVVAEALAGHVVSRLRDESVRVRRVQAAVGGLLEVGVGDVPIRGDLRRHQDVLH